MTGSIFEKFGFFLPIFNHFSFAITTLRYAEYIHLEVIPDHVAISTPKYLLSVRIQCSTPVKQRVAPPLSHRKGCRPPFLKVVAPLKKVFLK
jgi:hypothetical protein